jgi:hypothetical protein
MKALFQRAPKLLEIILRVWEIFWRGHYVKTAGRTDALTDFLAVQSSSRPAVFTSINRGKTA